MCNLSLILSCWSEYYEHLKNASHPHQWLSCTSNYWRRKAINSNPYEWQCRQSISWVNSKNIIFRDFFFFFNQHWGCISVRLLFDHCSCLKIHPLHFSAACMLKWVLPIMLGTVVFLHLIHVHLCASDFHCGFIHHRTRPAFRANKLLLDRYRPVWRLTNDEDLMDEKKWDRDSGWRHADWERRGPHCQHDARDVCLFLWLRMTKCHVLYAVCPLAVALPRSLCETLKGSQVKFILFIFFFMLLHPLQTPDRW